MTSAIERAARAIYDLDVSAEGDWDECKEYWIRMATAAFMAVREPTESMVDRAYRAETDDPVGSTSIIPIWRAMIDDLLKDA